MEFMYMYSKTVPFASFLPSTIFPSLCFIFLSPSYSMPSLPSFRYALQRMDYPGWRPEKFKISRKTAQLYASLSVTDSSLSFSKFLHRYELQLKID